MRLQSESVHCCALSQHKPNIIDSSVNTDDAFFRYLSGILLGPPRILLTDEGINKIRILCGGGWANTMCYQRMKAYKMLYSENDDFRLGFGN